MSYISTNATKLFTFILTAGQIPPAHSEVCVFTEAVIIQVISALFFFCNMKPKTFYGLSGTKVE